MCIEKDANLVCSGASTIFSAPPPSPPPRPGLQDKFCSLASLAMSEMLHVGQPYPEVFICDNDIMTRLLHAIQPLEVQ